MRSIGEVKVEVTLHLNNAEATWLKDYLQNGGPAEYSSDKAMREVFFYALQAGLEGRGMPERYAVIPQDAVEDKQT